MGDPVDDLAQRFSEQIDTYRAAYPNAKLSVYQCLAALEKLRFELTEMLLNTRNNP